MHYVLIAYMMLVGYGSLTPSMVSAEFNDIEACERAKTELGKAMNHDLNQFNPNQTNSMIECFSKGTH